MSEPHSNKKLFLLMVPAALSWAGAFVAGKIAVAEFPPFTLTFLRFLMAALIVFPIMVRYETKDWRLKKSDMGSIFWIGFVGIFAYHVLFFLALRYTTATNASLIGSASPMTTCIIAALVLRERLGAKRVGAILLAFFGVFLTITKGSLDIFRTLSFNTGDILMLGAMLCQASHSVLSKRVMPKYSPLIILSYSFVVGVVILIPFVIFENPLAFIPYMTWKGWSAVIYMAVFASAMGYLLQQFSIKAYGAGKTMLFVNLVPVFSIILSALILHERATILTLISAGIIMGAVYLNSRIKTL